MSNGHTTNSDMQIQCNPHKIQMTLFTELEKSVLKFFWKNKRPKIVKAILSKKSKAGSIAIPDLKLYYRAVATQTAQHWHKIDMMSRKT